ncbi:response regulator transcription factor [Clostridium oryzae]|uniref:Stage 0 sporulation protein A homolog n=1 Tax=Clostridium oryzae TaxID=1450648 RepID=A0A1V4INY7_9CLOT|nr:response regulator [Clostridium oryzae]OPJ61187.1 putative response regulatory protein [Clostridium oryzae]
MNKALFVDDEPFILEYLREIVDWEQFGYSQVDTSTDSKQALKLLQSNDYYLLITDIRMPEISGLDLLKDIHEKKLSTKVILLTGYSDFCYVQEAIRLGATDYLLKPILKEDMEESLNLLISDSEDGNENVSENSVENSSHVICQLNQYIRKHLDEDLSLTKLGEKVFLHPSYLSRLYKNETGHSISHFIQEEKMKKAASLLLDTNLRIKDIAEQVGYQKVQYFITLFKHYSGETPQQYRNSKEINI